MTQEVAYRFIEALAALEDSGQIDPLLGTFSEACDLASSSSADIFNGKPGAHEYWTRYRKAFHVIHSDIRNIITGDDNIALEWTTLATDTSGKQIQYNGVSILETRGEAIVRFRAYFDVKQAAEKIPARSVTNNRTASASGA
jgi:hypothetical protein